MEDQLRGDGMISGNVHIVNGCCVGIVTTSNLPNSEPVSPIGIQQSPQSSNNSATSPASPGISAAPSPLQNDGEQKTLLPNIAHDQDANIVMAESNSTRQVFVPCKVCGDKASGYHYGVTSCEGCKGFFRRSIQKQIEYRCLRDGKCLVMRLNRNRCQYCRFKKCLAVGMSRDSVRYGRVPKRSKSQDESCVSTTEQQHNQAELERRQLATYDIILTVSQAHHANCSTTDEKIKAINRKTATLVSKLDVGTATLATEQMLEAHRCQMFQNLASYVLPAIQQVVEFAKRIPDFPDFSQDDQLILIKSSFYEMWLTRMAKLFNCSDNSLTLEDGSVIPKGELDIVYTPNIVSNMFSFAQGFCELKLNDTEIGLFSACLLINTNRPNGNTSVIEKLQNKLVEALRLQITRNHVSEPTLFSSLENKIKDLRHIGQLHSQLLVWFRQRWQVIKTPPLFAEIYDIRKLEDD